MYAYRYIYMYFISIYIENIYIYIYHNKVYHLWISCKIEIFINLKAKGSPWEKMEHLDHEILESQSHSTMNQKESKRMSSPASSLGKYDVFPTPNLS